MAIVCLLSGWRAGPMNGCIHKLAVHPVGVQLTYVCCHCERSAFQQLRSKVAYVWGPICRDVARGLFTPPRLTALATVDWEVQSVIRHIYSMGVLCEVKKMRGKQLKTGQVKESSLKCYLLSSSPPLFFYPFSFQLTTIIVSSCGELPIHTLDNRLILLLTPRLPFLGSIDKVQVSSLTVKLNWQP